jgi:hypothetical protein
MTTGRRSGDNHNASASDDELEVTKQKSATAIQKLFRGHEVRKKYRITQIADVEKFARVELLPPNSSESKPENGVIQIQIHQGIYTASWKDKNKIMTKSQTEAELGQPNVQAIQQAFANQNVVQEAGFVNWISNLFVPQLTDYDVMPIGNDPVIHGLENYSVAERRVGFCGTSGLRSLLLACELSGQVNETSEQKAVSKVQSPKLFIIDNSQDVYRFWHSLKHIATHANSENDFMKIIDQYLDKNPNEKIFAGSRPEEMLDPLIYYHEPDVSQFMKNLFTRFGYEFIKKTLIDNSFKKIKNQFALLEIADIYVYPSNIGVATHTGNLEDLMASIDTLSAKLSIHTNFCTALGRPERFYLIENPGLDSVAKLRGFQMEIPMQTAIDEHLVDPHQKLKL